MRNRLRSWTVPPSSASFVWFWIGVTLFFSALSLYHIVRTDYRDAAGSLSYGILAGLYAAEQHSRRVELGLLLRRKGRRS